MSPDGNHAYVADTGDNTIVEYNIARDGLLHLVNSASDPMPPLALAIAPNGRSLYSPAYGFGAASVVEYDVRQDGSLSLKNPPTVASGPEPQGIAISPNGRHAYVANNEGNSTISQYDIARDGVLTPRSRATVPDVSGAFAIIVAPGRRGDDDAQ